jgi:pyruvate, orthophosphate dikinase
MQTKNERFAWDAYRRLIQMYGKTVLGIDGSKFSHVLEEKMNSQSVASSNFLGVLALKELVSKFKEIVRAESGADFPQDPRE